MKRFILTLAAIVMAAGMVSAQDLAQATELYNKGAEAVTMKNWTEALGYFNQALEMGNTVGADAEELVNNCKNSIPEVSRLVAVDLVNDEKYDEALSQIEKTIKIATEFGNEEVVTNAKSIITDVYKRKGAAAVKIKDYAGAITSFQEAFKADTTDAKTALTIGQLLGSTGKTEEAIDILQHAAWNGAEEEAKEQMSNIYVKVANAAFKAGKNADAIAAVDKANALAENATAYLIAGQASQKLGKASGAIEYFEKYLSLKPDAKNASAIAFTVGALCQQQKNNSKAVEFYKMAQNDPKLGAQAKALIATLSK